MGKKLRMYRLASILLVIVALCISVSFASVFAQEVTTQQATITQLQQKTDSLMQQYTQAVKKKTAEINKIKVETTPIALPSSVTVTTDSVSQAEKQNELNIISSFSSNLESIQAAIDTHAASQDVSKLNADYKALQQLNPATTFLSPTTDVVQTHKKNVDELSKKTTAFVNARLTSLEELRSKIDDDKKLDTVTEGRITKQGLLSKIDSEITSIASIKTRIATATQQQDTATLKKIITDVYDAHTISVFVPQMDLLRLALREKSILRSYQAYYTRIQARANTLFNNKQNNESFLTISQGLQSMNGLLTDANKNGVLYVEDSILSSTSTLSVLSVPPITNDTYQKIRPLMQDLSERLKNGNDKLLLALKLGQTINEKLTASEKQTKSQTSQKSPLLSPRTPSTDGSKQDAYSKLRKRWITLITGDYSATETDPIVVNRSISIGGAALKAKGRIDALVKKNDTKEQPITTVAAEYYDLIYMSLGYSAALSGNKSYQNEELKNSIIAGLDWLYQNAYNDLSSPNNRPSNAQIDPDYTYYRCPGNEWYYCQIDIPQSLTTVLMLMNDTLTPEQRTHYLGAERRFVPSVDTNHFTGANLVWLVKIVLGRGIIDKNDADIVDAHDKISNIFAYSTYRDGFYLDGSFIQHSNYPYNGGYGNSLLQDTATILYILDGSSQWPITDSNKDHVYQWVYDSFEPFTFNNIFMDSVRGREMARTSVQDYTALYKTIEAVYVLSETAPSRYKLPFKQMVKTWLLSDQTTYNAYFTQPSSAFGLILALEKTRDSSIPPRSVDAFNRVFYNMDRIVHSHPPDWKFGISMSSDRIFKYEAINAENLHGWYMGDGMTYLYTSDTKQFNDDYWPTINPYYLPGTTVSLHPRPRPNDKDLLDTPFKGNPWAGGVTLQGVYGSAGMDLVAATTKYKNISLQAKKSWFMFDKEVVALGAGITSVDPDYAVVTTVENRKLDPTRVNTFTDNISDKNWAYLEGVGGYYFPPQPDVDKTMLLTEEVTEQGSWYDINELYGFDAKGNKLPTVSKQYRKIWFDHGKNPADATKKSKYAYMILPLMSQTDVAKYAKTPNVKILKNDSTVQAVYNDPLKIVAANFFDSQIGITYKTKTSHTLTTSAPVAVMLQEKEKDSYMNIVIADPARKQKTVQITLTNFKAKGFDKNFTDGSVTTTITGDTIILDVAVDKTKGAGQKVRILL